MNYTRVVFAVFVVFVLAGFVRYFFPVLAFAFVTLPLFLPNCCFGSHETLTMPNKARTKRTINTAAVTPRMPPTTAAATSAADSAMPGETEIDIFWDRLEKLLLRVE